MITVNSCISTSLGGIETLIREVQSLFKGTGARVTEFFKYRAGKHVYSESPAVTYICYGEESKAGYVAKIKTALNLWRQLKKLAPVGEDLLVFHPTDLLYIPGAVLKANNVIMVQTNRLDIIFTPLGKLAMSLRGKYINHFTVYTSFDEAELGALYPQFKSRIKIIPRASKIEKARAIPAQSKKLLTLARVFEDQKNFKAMVEVMGLLPTDYSLDIYGDGSEQEVSDLKTLIADDSRITYKGSSNKVEEIYKEYSLFLMTSRYEGFGQTLVEARSQGLPIILFDTFPAAKWIVRDGENGYLIPPYDIAAMSEKIITVLGNPQVYTSFGQRALVLAEETSKGAINDSWKGLSIEL